MDGIWDPLPIRISCSYLLKEEEDNIAIVMSHSGDLQTCRLELIGCLYPGKDCNPFSAPENC